MEQDMKAKIDLACRTAEDFTKFYYDTVDKRRHTIAKSYMDKGSLVWNGNGVEGRDNINKFWLDLPTTHHTISTLDAHPVTVSDQLSFLVKVGGNVRIADKPTKPFNQNFLITALDGKWKIVSDCFRMQETAEVSA